MQTVFHYLTLLLTGALLQAQNTVEVTMTHFSNNDGKARVGLYNTATDFLEKEFRTQETTIVDQTAQVVFSDLPDGTYAISCYHDEDNNGALNMRFGMIPAEDYGCSNNARGFFGPPQWDDARFEVKNGVAKQLTIRLN